jgi:GNAT superfamily N-acetyltransferase
LLGPGGRLVIARHGGEPVGVGALKPVDATTGEIKRMYVRPGAQGLGIGRALLTRLVDDARSEGYAGARLETLPFMTAGLAMYRSFGFVETGSFAGSESSSTGLEPITVFMHLTL